MVKVKIGAITKEVPKGSLKWYLEAGWKVVEEEGKKDDKTDSKKNVAKSSDIPEV